MVTNSNCHHCIQKYKKYPQVVQLLSQAQTPCNSSGDFYSYGAMVTTHITIKYHGIFNTGHELLTG